MKKVKCSGCGMELFYKGDKKEALHKAHWRDISKCVKFCPNCDFIVANKQ